MVKDGDDVAVPIYRVLSDGGYREKLLNPPRR